MYKTTVKRSQREKNKQFLGRLREAKAANRNIFWKMISKKKSNIVEASVDELEKHFMTLNDRAADEN